MYEGQRCNQSARFGVHIPPIVGVQTWRKTTQTEPAIINTSLEPSGILAGLYLSRWKKLEVFISYAGEKQS